MVGAESGRVDGIGQVDGVINNVREMSLASWVCSCPFLTMKPNNARSWPCPGHSALTLPLGEAYWLSASRPPWESNYGRVHVT